VLLPQALALVALPCAMMARAVPQSSIERWVQEVAEALPMAARHHPLGGRRGVALEARAVQASRQAELWVPSLASAPLAWLLVAAEAPH